VLGYWKVVNEKSFDIDKHSTLRVLDMVLLLSLFGQHIQPKLFKATE